MVSLQDTAICLTCGEEYWFDLDCRTGKYTKLSMCKCDRMIMYAREFLKKKGLLDEFDKYMAEREKEEKEEEEDEIK